MIEVRVIISVALLLVFLAVGYFIWNITREPEPQASTLTVEEIERAYESGALSIEGWNQSYNLDNYTTGIRENSN